MKKHLTIEELNRLNELMDGSEAKSPEEEVYNNLKDCRRVSGIALDELEELLGLSLNVSGCLSDPAELSEDVIASCAGNVSRMLDIMDSLLFTLEEIHGDLSEDLEIFNLIGLDTVNNER